MQQGGPLTQKAIPIKMMKYQNKERGERHCIAIKGSLRIEYKMPTKVEHESLSEYLFAIFPSHLSTWHK